MNATGVEEIAFSARLRMAARRSASNSPMWVQATFRPRRSSSATASTMRWTRL